MKDKIELISKNDLLDEINASRPFLNEWEYRGMVSIVERQKTQAVQDRAAWVKSYGLLTCTRCRFRYHIRFDFCPGCGSRMDDSTNA